MQKIRILSWNVNGIRASIKKGFFQWLANLQETKALTILGIQETKAQPKQVPLTLLPSTYQAYWHSAQRKGYSGVSLFSQIKPNKVSKRVFNIAKFDDEGRVIKAEFNNFILYNVYFPNGKRDQERLDYKLEFYEEFLTLIEKERAKGKNIVFFGDVNTAHKPVDLARPKNNEKISGFLPIEREWLDKVKDFGYIDTFRHFNPEESEIPEKRHYTWWSVRARGAREKNVGWRIDYFFVNKEFIRNVTDAFILDKVHGSDHCPLGIEIEVKE